MGKITDPQDFKYEVSPDTTPGTLGHLFTPTIHSDTYPFISPRTLNLIGRSVLITGGNKGVGKAICLSFARAGCTYISLSVRRPVPNLASDIIFAATSAGRPAPIVTILHFDVCDLASVKAGAETLRKKVGRLDILINNAGIMPYLLPFLEQSEHDHWKGWETNYRGSFYVTKNFLPLLIDTDGGLKTVIFETSVAAQQVGLGSSHYHISKMALCKLAEFVNFEFADRGILSYAVHPGAIRTDMSKELPQSFFGELLTDTPELAGDSIVWLTSSRREFLGGRYVACNWDMKELLAKQKEIVEKQLLLFRCNFGQLVKAVKL